MTFFFSPFIYYAIPGGDRMEGTVRRRFLLLYVARPCGILGLYDWLPALLVTVRCSSSSQVLQRALLAWLSPGLSPGLIFVYLAAHFGSGWHGLVTPCHGMITYLFSYVFLYMFYNLFIIRFFFFNIIVLYYI